MLDLLHEQGVVFILVKTSNNRVKAKNLIYLLQITQGIFTKTRLFSRTNALSPWAR